VAGFAHTQVVEEAAGKCKRSETKYERLAS
jgi:hypothetical protein